MTPSEVRSFLAAGSKLHVATTGPRGVPHLTTVWYAYLDDRITFRSFTKSQRIVNLTRDPRLTVLVEEGNSYETLRGVMVEGIARLSDDRATVLRVYGLVTGRTGQAGDLDPDALEALFGRYADKNTVVVVEPERVASWDHRRLGGSY